MQLRTLLIVSLLLAVCAAAYLMQTKAFPQRGSHVRVIAAETDAKEGPRSDLVPVEGLLARRPVENELGATDDKDEPTDVVAAPSGSTGPLVAPWNLRLTVNAPSALEAALGPVEVLVRARPEGQPFASGETITASCPLGETTAIDIGRLAAAGVTHAAFIVEAKHDRLAAPPLSVPIMRAAHAGSVSAVGSRGATLREPLDATLQLRVLMNVSGRALIDGVPRAGTQVGIWRMESGEPVPGLVASTAVGDGGEFQLPLGSPGEYLIVAAHRDLLPAWTRFHVSEGAPHFAALDLELRAGEVLDGRFACGDDAPPYPVSFSLQSAAPGHRLHFDWMPSGVHPGHVQWQEGRVVRSTAEQVTTEDGAFHIAGLEPGPYEIHLHGFDEGHNRSDHPSIDVMAPAHGLRLDLGLALVRITMRPDLGSSDEGDPNQGAAWTGYGASLRGAVLYVEQEDREVEAIQCDGGLLWGGDTAEFVFAPGAAVTFRFDAPGLDPIVRQTVAPASGQRTAIVFSIPVPAGGSELRIALDGDVPPDGTKFIVHMASTLEGSAPPNLGSVYDTGAVEVSLEGGELKLDGLVAGPIRIVLYPASMVGHRSSYHVDGVVDVMAEPEGVTHARVNLALGGRLRIGKRVGAGWASAQATIRTAGGEVIPVTYIAYAENGGGGESAIGWLPRLAASQVIPNLPAGSYRIEVGGEFRVVEVRAGETAEVLFD